MKKTLIAAIIISSLIAYATHGAVGGRDNNSYVTRGEVNEYIRWFNNEWSRIESDLQKKIASRSQFYGTDKYKKERR